MVRVSARVAALKPYPKTCVCKWRDHMVNILYGEITFIVTIRTRQRHWSLASGVILSSKNALANAKIGEPLGCSGRSPALPATSK